MKQLIEQQQEFRKEFRKALINTHDKSFEFIAYVSFLVFFLQKLEIKHQKSFEKLKKIEITSRENMFSDFVFNSINKRRCFDILVNEMICVNNEFILDELLSNLVKRI